MSYLKSRQVSEQLQIPYWKLVYILRAGMIPQPQKDASGDLIWSVRDVKNAEKALGLVRKGARKRKEPSQA